jgi:hypothetical protein
VARADDGVGAGLGITPEAARRRARRPNVRLQEGYGADAARLMQRVESYGKGLPRGLWAARLAAPSAQLINYRAIDNHTVWT